MQWPRPVIFLLYTMLVFIGLGLLFLSFLLWNNDYDGFADILLKMVGKTDWQDYFCTTVFPPSRFLLARYVLLALLLAYIPFMLICFRRSHAWSEKITAACHYFYSAFRQAFSSLTNEQMGAFGLVFGLFLLRSFWSLSHYEIDYDEAWTYNHFSSKGALISAISPNNNHILYSIVSSLFDYLPIPTKYAIRLPAFLSVAVMLCIFFAYMHKRYGYAAALISLSVLAFSPSINAYSILARGYGFMLLFTLLSYIALEGISLKTSKNHYYTGLYVVSSILGVYSNPAFLLLWLPFTVFFWGRSFYKGTDRKLIWSFVYSNLIILTALVLLHLPILLSNGFKILGEASVAARAEDSTQIIGIDFWYYLHRVADWLLFGHKALLFWLWMGLSGLFLAVAIIKRKQSNVFSPLLLLSFLLLMPLFWMLLTRIQVPYRLWCGEAVFLSMGLGIVFSVFLKRAAFFIALLFGSLMFLGSSSHYFLNWSAALDKEAKKIAGILMSKGTELSECYSFSRYDKPLLTYYFNIHHRPFKCWMPFKESKDYRPFGARAYQSVLLDVDDYTPTEADLAQLKLLDYRLVYENNRIKLFLANTERK